MATLHVSERGTGPALVLLHGLTGTSAAWEDQMPVLERAGWRAVALDLRGHGGSSRDGGQWTIDDMADDVLETIDALGISRFGLVGHSLGGRVMWSLALKVSDRVEFLVPVGAQSEAPSGKYQDAMWAWRAALLDGGLSAFAKLFAADGEMPERIARDQDYARGYRERFLRNEPRALVACLDAIMSMRCYTQELERLRCPVLVLVGTGDINFLTAAAQYESRIALARVEAIPACGHYPMIDQPERFNAALLAFLEEVALDALR